MNIITPHGPVTCSHTDYMDMCMCVLYSTLCEAACVIFCFWCGIMTSLHLSSTSAHSRPQWSVLYVTGGHGTACFLDCAVSLCSISFSRLSLLQQLACNELREMLHCSSPPKKRTLHVLRLIRAYITCLYRGPVYTKSLVPWSKWGYADASKSEKRSRGLGGGEGWKVTVIRASRCYWSTFVKVQHSAAERKHWKRKSWGR